MREAFFFIGFAIGLCAGILAQAASPFEIMDRNVVMVIGRDSRGTGVQVQLPSGEIGILTNNHVCADNVEGFMTLRWDSGTKVPGQVVKADPDPDLCFIRATLPQTHVQLAVQYYLGEVVFSSGHPRADPLTHTQGVWQKTTLDDITFEKVPQRKCPPGYTEIERTPDHELHVYCQKHQTMGVTTLQVAPGSSGSPVVNSRGELVGLVFAYETADGAGLIVPLEYIKRFLETVQ